VFFDLEPAFVAVAPIQDIGRLAFGGPDRQDVEMAVLIGDPGVELAARVVALVGVDIRSFGSAAGGPKKLAIRGRGRAGAPRFEHRDARAAR
jgi:hypothetical protein